MSYLEDNGTFTFDGVNSADYGVWITGANTYSAPPRRFEEITIPGKSGVLTLDQRAFEDIEHTYPAFIRRNFPSNIEGIRNQLLSRSGKKVLTDSYHPDEFYLAKFMQGVDVEVGSRAIAGRFDLVFKRDPRRFLKSGETPVTIGEWGETTEHSGSITTFEAVDSDAVKSLKVSLEPVQSGSGDPSPSNVRAISGLDSVEVFSADENLLRLNGNTQTKSGVTCEPMGDGSIHVYGTNTSSGNIYFEIGSTEELEEGSYYIYGLPKGASNTTYFITRNGSSGNVYYGGMTQLSGVCAPRIYVRAGVALDVVFKLVFSKVAKVYTLPLGGTYYGGTLDVVSGVLTVDRAITTIGALTWTMYTVTEGNLFRSQTIKNDIKPVASASEVINAICSAYKATSQSNRAAYTMTTGIGSGSGNIDIVDSSYTSANGFKTAMADQTICYDLATPQNIQLTPQQVALLVGANNIWSDSGDVTVEVGTNPNMLINPTLFASKPLIRVTGYGTLTVGSDVITIANNFAYVDIDSEVGDCYHGTDNANASVSFQQNDFPELAPGATGIAYSGHITKVEITPRWWRL